MLKYTFNFVQPINSIINYKNLKIRYDEWLFSVYFIMHNLLMAVAVATGMELNMYTV